MVLEEKGIAYERREENLAELSEELLSMHPEGRVPLLVHETAQGKEVIYQSTVITEYLDEVFPGPKLMPLDPVLRARARLWTYWCDTLFKPDLDLFKYEFPKKGEARTLKEEECTDLLKRLYEMLEHWDGALKSGQYLLGQEMTLADIHLFPFARQFTKLTPAFPGIEKFTHLQAWLVKMVARPAFDRVMAK
jgi:glutathione S-transferase